MAKSSKGGARRAGGQSSGGAGGATKGGPDSQETVLSFRVDRHLAEALNRLPDRSAFIRRAILRAFYRACPACHGKGVLPEAAGEPIERFIEKSLPARCECCGFAYPAAEAAGKKRFVCADCTDHEPGEERAGGVH